MTTVSSLIGPPLSEVRPVRAANPAPADRAAPVRELATPKVALPQASTLTFDPTKARENLKAAIQELNEQMEKTGRDLSFGIDEALNRVVVTIKSSKTGEVIRQIPDEAFIKFAHSVKQLKGLFHDSAS
jgi:flagellar protein FlaG